MDSLSLAIETQWLLMQKLNDEIERLEKERNKYSRRIRNLRRKFRCAEHELIRLETIQFEIDLQLEKQRCEK